MACRKGGDSPAPSDNHWTLSGAWGVQGGSGAPAGATAAARRRRHPDWPGGRPGGLLRILPALARRTWAASSRWTGPRRCAVSSHRTSRLPPRRGAAPGACRRPAGRARVPPHPRRPAHIAPGRPRRRRRGRRLVVAAPRARVSSVSRSSRIRAGQTQPPGWRHVDRIGPGGAEVLTTGFAGVGGAACVLGGPLVGHRLRDVLPVDAMGAPPRQEARRDPQGVGRCVADADRIRAAGGPAADPPEDVEVRVPAQSLGVVGVRAVQQRSQGAL